MNLFDYPPRVEIYSIWKNSEPRHVPLPPLSPPQDARLVYLVPFIVRGDAVHDIPHFLRVFIETPTATGERRSRE